MSQKSVGAALPSLRFLGDKMIEGIDLKKVNYIVKYGPSTRVLKGKLIIRRRNLMNCNMA
ncbi:MULTISPECIES: ribose ABC transporter ATP-binding protein [Bacillus cereus group]|uniref:ribose ABC transporter ATP-binding protein n=1 Tax=Bacillus cereus group TaxID=86661 RepID=UPI000992313A|nr:MULTISPECIES: ribose ABC transporter ATP-binding protein [Bacillus cereus group]OOR15202.1 ribose ABC transporter ATP-binding protein [Bacillus mycoides]OOR53841.1 ribose ABC transporter ATP-binding protein [Bacillus mycoides]QWG76649.1 ribose ABC transporter ATP-binding protein [Bacillus mycoides]QWG84635.1 ribose ABC transporter ATP-binding protein [Bacillus mycoides]TXR72005.1 ribose ABC transporter ATP-binding protein [Bacillus sp. AR13-1]